jgi:hypothetical protein
LCEPWSALFGIGSTHRLIWIICYQQ